MRVVALLVLLACCLFGRAEAACTPMAVDSNHANCGDEGEALAWAQAHVPVPSGPSTGCSKDKWTNIQQVKPDHASWATTYSHPEGCGYPKDGIVYSYAQYPSDKTCSSRPPIYQGWFQGNPGGCISGCMYETGDIKQDWRYRDSRDAGKEIRGREGFIKPTGATCSVEAPEPPPPPPKDDYCALLEGGYKICPNKKGDPCVVSGKTGRTYCGTAQDGMNATNPERTENVSTGPTSPTPTPPTPPTPRPGEEWQPDRTVTGVNVTNNVTQITNISNQAGTPNTNPGDGNPGDGSDNPGKGEDDGDGGSAGGGATCDAPPTCSGDPIACATLDQTWRNRCASTKGDKNGNGRPDWTELGEGEGSEGPTPGNGQDEKAKTWGLESLLDKVDDSGFIGGACPALPTIDVPMVGSFDPNFSWWCDVLEVIGNLFVFIASCIAVRILVS